MPLVAHAFPLPGHDHGLCVDAALAAAEVQCRDRGVRLTTLRRRVLELVWRGHGPVGAYTLLETLRGDGLAAAAPTVYRALDFLLTQGLIHRLERRNAFIGCPNPEMVHSGQFLICTGCGAVAEIDDDDVGQAVRRAAGRHGFTVVRPTVEVEGLCPGCAQDGAANP